MKLARLGAILALASHFAASGAMAQDDYPNRAITLVTPFMTGGAADSVARAIAQGMAQQLGQAVVVENRAGASGMIGMAAAAKAPADGYTVVLSTDGVFSNPATQDERSQAILKALVPVANVAQSPLVLAVAAGSSVHQVSDLAALARERKAPLTYGTSGFGTAHHLAGALLAEKMDMEMTAIPYKGTSAAVTDLVSGELDMLWGNMSAIRPLIASNKVRAVAVASPDRFSLMPDLPTVAQTYPGFEMIISYGIMTPAGTDPSIVSRLTEAVRLALSAEPIRKTIQNADLDPNFKDAAAYGDMIKSMSAERGKIVHDAGITVH